MVVKVSARTTQSNPNWLRKLIKEYNEKSEAVVGFPSGAGGNSLRYPAQRTGQDGVVVRYSKPPTVLEVAFRNYYGVFIDPPAVIANPNKVEDPGVSGETPPRPFLKLARGEINKRTAPVAKESIKRINIGEMSKKTALSLMGAVSVGAVQSTIRGLKVPPNSPRTVRFKGSDNPLVDTGRLAQSVTYAVREPSGG